MASEAPIYHTVLMPPHPGLSLVSLEYCFDFTVTKHKNELVCCFIKELVRFCYSSAIVMWVM